MGAGEAVTVTEAVEHVHRAARHRVLCRAEADRLRTLYEAAEKTLREATDILHEAERTLVRTAHESARARECWCIPGYHANNETLVVADCPTHGRDK